MSGGSGTSDPFDMTKRTTLHRTVLAVLAVTVAGSLAACQPTGHPRCDRLTSPNAKAEAFGYRVRCNATFPGVSTSGKSVLGWTDHANRTIWLWPGKMGDDRVLRKVAWHEVGHVAWDRLKKSGTQATEEKWAEGYAYCAEPIKGVGYSSRPSDCRGYRA